MKLINFDQQELEQKAEALKAIAHPVRIAILHYLIENKKLSVTEIHELLNMEQATTSHHLGILKNRGVLASQRDGKNTFYFIKNDQLKKLVDSIIASKV